MFKHEHTFLSLYFAKEILYNISFIAHPWTLFHIWKKISRKKQIYKVKILIKFTVIKFSSFNVVCLCQGPFVHRMKITPFINLYLLILYMNS